MKNKGILLVTLAVLIFTGCTLQPGDEDFDFYRNGNDTYIADAKTWPKTKYAIRYTYYGYCNGAFLSPVLILTAAHCLEGKAQPNPGSKITIEYYSSSGERKTTVVSFKNYAIAPALGDYFYKGSKSRDVAVMFLAGIDKPNDLPILTLINPKKLDSIPIGGSVAIHSIHDVSYGDDYQYTTRKAPYSPPASSYGADYPLGHNFFTEVRPNARHGDSGGVYIAYFRTSYFDNGVSRVEPYALATLSVADISTRTSIYYRWLEDQRIIAAFSWKS
ncbi:trypsin-like serine protease [Candidatus Haliotispira prima]|uniref:Trypsin-like serine protease n=1 Tax=Candidatus Haliotispira prima TaxID=3034016 RepID=A0ABY8MIX8_9SPIO|nr:trypsin-like serine protease [Candidatus Haliotispira prima]